MDFHISLFSFLFIISIIVKSSADSPLETSVNYKGKYEHLLPKGSEGIKRFLLPSKGEGSNWQFFYFCDIPKNKKKCGAWVDEKGVKVKGANNEVKRTKEGAVILKMTEKDSGVYTRVPENSNEVSAYLERFHVYVQGPPPPPLHPSS